MTAAAAIAVAAIALSTLLVATAARADAPVADGVITVVPAEIDDIVDRLRGQRLTVASDRRSIVIDDAAGDGRPWVGAVERRGEVLWLVTASGALRLAGALARPRLAGPGYTVWATGAVDGEVLVVRRIGVVRRPRR